MRVFGGMVLIYNWSYCVQVFQPHSDVIHALVIVTCALKSNVTLNEQAVVSRRALEKKGSV